jgi:hypothetical protein
MICITGDTHGTIDISKLNHVASALRKVDDENHYMIIAGDFGMIWQQSYSDSQINTKDMIAIRRVYEKKPWITLFVDGNHENFDILDNLPVTEKWGGKVHEITPYCYHLMRGEVYDIEGVKILALGGAHSVDKAYRKPGVSWWPQEELSEADVANAKANLAKHNNEVDFVVSHACPQHVLSFFESQLPPWDASWWGPKGEDKTCKRLSDATKDAKYKAWYFGHYHEDLTFHDSDTDIDYKMLFNNITVWKGDKV